MYCCCGACCSSYTSRCIDISLIVVNAISFVLSLISLVIIKWKNVSIFSLIISILLFLFTVSLLILSIIIHFWRKVGSIKTTTKENAQRISNAGFALTIILFFICIICISTLSNDFYKANYPCGSSTDRVYTSRNLVDKNSVDCNHNGAGSYVEVVTIGEYAISYFCLSYTEIAMIVAMFLWRSSRIRIINGVDGAIPPPQPIIVQQPVVYGAQYPPYGYNGQMPQQYVFIEGNVQYDQGRYVIQPNMYEGEYSSNQYRQQGQYQQQNVPRVQQEGSDNFNVLTKPGAIPSIGNNQGYYSTGRNINEKGQFYG